MKKLSIVYLICMLALLSAQGGMTFTLGTNNANSSFLVTNPNSDPLCQIYGNGFTGFGTTPPMFPFHFSSNYWDSGGSWAQPVGYFQWRGTGSYDGVGVWGDATSAPEYYGLGVRGSGNYIGGYFDNITEGYEGEYRFGAYGYAESYYGMPVGVRGWGWGGCYPFGGEFYGTYGTMFGYGVWGEGYSSPSNYGLAGMAHDADPSAGFNCGGYFEAYGVGNNHYGIFARAYGGTHNWAGYFEGSVYVNGTLSKAAGSFKIDHPLDPDNKYLAHSFVESPDMMNIYNGNIVLDYSGEAEIELPEWFEALNRDFRYQLTSINAPGPNLYVSEEVNSNRFRIAGGSPGMKVSWQVTGIRKDAYANAHRIEVEENKMGKDIGNFLHPKELGFSEERSINAEPIKQAREKTSKAKGQKVLKMK